MTLESYWLQICPYYEPSVVIYDRKMFIRLATGISTIVLIVTDGSVNFEPFNKFVFEIVDQRTFQFAIT